MRKLVLFFSLLLIAGGLLAQKSITGTVSDQNGEPLIGANILVKGTAVGAVTDVDGAFSVTLPEGHDVLVVSYTGYGTQEVTVGDASQVSVVLTEGLVLSEAVVTALGVSREKKSLGYATQEVSGDELSVTKTDNFVNSLSGRVSGVEVKRTTNMGGSTNIVIRGHSSLQYNNQPLFVVDGVPIFNRETNTRYQEQGGADYDFGNSASDINPEDIASVNVLKGAAATALYGSRAQNGVIMITTKNGSTRGKGIGVTVNSAFTVGSIDKSTWVKYQHDYGAGYGPYYAYDNYFDSYDVNGDGVEDPVTPLTEDASRGAKFDGRLVYQWDAFDPSSKNYLTATPWEAAKNDPTEFFETPMTWVNTVSLDKATEDGDFRLSYTNYNQNGLMPNSELKRNNISFKSNFNLTDRFRASAFANYINDDAVGRNSTGYGNGPVSSFRQWWQMNTDILEQKDAYFNTKRNVTWNYSGPFNYAPIYWDNPYWVRYENYENDNRDRFLGYASLTYKITDWLDIYGRASVDNYSEAQEQRKAVGSVPGRFGIGTLGGDGSIGRLDVGSGYARMDIRNTQKNYDVWLKFNKDLGDKLNINGLLGGNVNRRNINSVYAATNGGIVVPGLYALKNSASVLPNPIEVETESGINGAYADASIGYDNFLYVEGSIRRDESSTLPKDERVYYYPSVSGSFVFTRFINQDWLSFGKLRANYAEVGNDAPALSIQDVYGINTAFNGSSASLSNTKKNSELKPEQLHSSEIGLEMGFLDNRISFDVAYYKTKAINQILPVRASSSTGYQYKVINSGEIENKGVEVSLKLNPVKSANFDWNMTVNWTRNRNKVVSLTEGLNNLQLASFQGGVTLNAQVGQPYGVLYGSDFVYNENGQPIVNSGGYYTHTSNFDNVIGDPNPDWVGGVFNKFSYKNWDLSFLVDMQQGGDIWYLDLWYGYGTGLYDVTAGLNELGNPIRDPVTADNTSGGFINPGVNADGTPNTTRTQGSTYSSLGWARDPNARYIYDLSYVKLREVALSYTFPHRWFENVFIRDVSLSFVGSNVWIIHKNIPYVDPESGLGSGNIQGYTVGSLPTTRDFTFNVKVRF